MVADLAMAMQVKGLAGLAMTTVFMGNDIAWFIKTCNICQMRKTQNVLIPPTVASPAPLFSKIYIDTMHMPPSSGYKYIVQGRCSLVHWPEFDKLRKENA